MRVLESQMDRGFRSIVLDLLLRMFAELEEPDFVAMCQCLIKLEKPEDVANILQRLVNNKASYICIPSEHFIEVESDG